jgi:hypothetical protein
MNDRSATRRSTGPPTSSGCEVADVRALQVAHAGIRAEPLVELAVADVDGDHLGGAVLSRQSVKPPVDAPASRQRVRPGRRRSAPAPPRASRRPGPTKRGWRPDELDRLVGRDLVRRLGGDGAGDEHPAGGDVGLGPLAAVGQAPPHELGVEAASRQLRLLGGAGLLRRPGLLAGAAVPPCLSPPEVLPTSPGAFVAGTFAACALVPWAFVAGAFVAGAFVRRHLRRLRLAGRALVAGILAASPPTSAPASPLASSSVGAAAGRRPAWVQVPAAVPRATPGARPSRRAGR